jgi:hypothetical protein
MIKAIKVTKNWESRFFLLFFLDYKGYGSVFLSNGSGSKRTKIIRIRISNTASLTKRCEQTIINYGVFMPESMGGRRVSRVM